MARRDEADRLQARWMSNLRNEARGAMLVAAAAPLVSGALLLAQAWLLASVLHQAIFEHVPPEALLPQIASLAALLAGRALLGLLAERKGIEAAEQIKLAVRRTLFARLIAERPEWTAARASGTLASVVVDQVEALEGFFSRFFPAMVQAAILPLAFAVALFPVDWVVGLLFLCTAPMIPVFMALVGWGAEAANKAQAEAFTRLGGRFADRLRGILTLKLFGRADSEVERMRNAGEELRVRTLRVLRIAFMSSAVLEFFAALGVAGVALYVGLTYLELIDLRGGSVLTLQAGLFCLLMAPEVYQPLRVLAAHYHDRAAAKAAVAEIAAAFEELPVVQPAPAAVATSHVGLSPTPSLAVEMRRVSIYTPGHGRLVLNAVDLQIPAGSHIALLGASGIGKSTLLEALAGLRETYGEVLLDGEGLPEIDEAELRARVAFIGQRPRLFHGTIAENIRLGRRDASNTELHAAAARARVTEFSDTLPDKLHTRLGEGGLGLSGGEAHRVALARLYLRQPGLILLDEPTAHLDAATEARVLDGLLSFAATRTLLVATHSAAVAERMGRAYRLAGGKLLRAPVMARRTSRALEGVA